MPVPGSSFGWQEAIAAFAVVSLVAFLVTWLVTDLGHVRRTPYVAVLTGTTLALAAGYLAWSRTTLSDLLRAEWGPGLLGAAAAAAVVGVLVRRLPRRPRPEGAALVGRLVWEGVVYGAAEAILLSTLPVLAVWQGADALGWTDTTSGGVGSGALAIVGAMFVIAVHHLGYREFRGRAGRKMLVGALAACGVQALAFLLTGSALAPIIAHIVLHGQLTLRGDEMPPSEDLGEPSGAGRPRPITAARRRELVP